MNNPSAYGGLPAGVDVRSYLGGADGNYGVQQAQAYQKSQQEGAAIPPSPRELDQHIERIAEKLHFLAHMADRIGGVANRVMGPQPEPVENANASQPSGTSLVAKLGLIDAALARVNQTIGNSIERLEKFI